MKCKEIIEIIERDYPRFCALKWDNVGLLVGRDDREVRCIYVALDATDEVIEDAAEKGADMLITHHPLIFEGMKRVTNQDFIGRRLIRLIRNDISCYAMHTNYDVLGMSVRSGERLALHDPEILEVTEQGEEPKGIGRVADLESELTLSECCRLVKDGFQLESVRVFGDLDGKIRRMAVSPGSGKSMIGAALDKGADVLVTGDIDHHTGIDAAAQGLAVIDAGHYGIEHIFVEDMGGYLRNVLEGVTVRTAPVRHPFHTV